MFFTSLEELISSIPCDVSLQTIGNDMSLKSVNLTSSSADYSKTLYLKIFSLSYSSEWEIVVPPES